MEILIYIIIFIIGSLFGSFYTLAVYRIPKRQDITHTRSYCPNCDHKLGFFDMFPILSYIFLGGKCRYCKQKISPRYILLEIFSGATFVAIFYLMEINIYTITIPQMCKFALFALYITFVFLTIGIDKENRKIENPVSVYGIIISLMYIAYLCIVEKANIYRYAIYIVFYILVLILDTITLKKFAKSKYINGVLLTVITMAIFTKETIALLTIEFTALIVTFYMLLKKIKSLKNVSLKTETKIGSNLPIAFYLGIANIITLIALPIIANFK